MMDAKLIARVEDGEHVFVRICPYPGCGEEIVENAQELDVYEVETEDEQGAKTREVVQVKRGARAPKGGAARGQHTEVTSDNYAQHWRRAHG
jgi:hypothetical protein